MKMLVISHGGYGKDTFCEIIRDEFGTRFVSSSYFMSEKLIFDNLKDLYGYKSVQECCEDRRNHRSEWFNIIRDYSKNDQARLAREILESHDVYCGMRCATQFEASKHLFDLVIWIDAEKRIGSVESSNSMTITKDCADIIIENNGTLDEFREKVIKVMRLFYNV